MAPRPRERYLIAGQQSGMLQEVVAELRSDPEIVVLDSIGSPDKPDVLVVAMTAEHARRLQTRFAGKLIIEKDAALSPS